MVNRARARTSRSRIDRDYPHQVDIEVPEGGLGKRLNAMHRWCGERAPDYVTVSVNDYPRQAVRFGFRSDGAARRFASRFDAR